MSEIVSIKGYEWFLCGWQHVERDRVVLQCVDQTLLMLHRIEQFQSDDGLTGGVRYVPVKRSELKEAE